jgi:hypothetical protein
MLEETYKLVEVEADVTLLHTEEQRTQIEQRETHSQVSLVPYETILNCSICFMAPTYNKYEDADQPPSISRRFSIFCPKCSKHPLRMFTLEGMINYWNRVRK